MVICLEQSADLHMAQLMPLPLTVSCFSKIQIGFTFLVPAHLGSPGKEPLDGFHVTRFAALFLKCKYSVFFEHAVSFLPSEYVKNCTKITLSCRRICCFL